jgi:hypothetical protein
VTAAVVITAPNEEQDGYFPCALLLLLAPTISAASTPSNDHLLEAITPLKAELLISIHSSQSPSPLA